MPRNFLRRIEVVFPIEDGRLRERIRTEILETMLRDNVKGALSACGRDIHASADRQRRPAPQSSGGNQRRVASTDGFRREQDALEVSQNETRAEPIRFKVLAEARDKQLCLRQ